MTTHATARMVSRLAGGDPEGPPLAVRACDARKRMARRDITLDRHVVESPGDRHPAIDCPACLVLIDAALDGRFLVRLS